MQRMLTSLFSRSEGATCKLSLPLKALLVVHGIVTATVAQSCVSYTFIRLQLGRGGPYIRTQAIVYVNGDVVKGSSVMGIILPPGFML
jgi:hypothetical protein